MAADMTKIGFGAGRIYVGATLPGVSAAPVFTAGVPAGGIDIGATKSLQITIKNDVYEIMVEQAHAPILVASTKVAAMIEIEAVEIDLDRFAQYLASATHIVAPNMVQGGTLVPVVTFSVVAVQQRLDDPTKLRHVMLYKAYCPDGIPLPFSREKESSYKVKFSALADCTRAVTDQIYQIGTEELFG